MKRILVFAFALACLVPAGFAATTFYADWENGSDSQDGLSAQKAFKSFERLVQAVNGGGAGSTGILAPGEYLLSSGPTCTVANATFKGASPDPRQTVVDGQGAYRCLYSTKNNVTVANLTIRRGYSEHPGGYGNGDANGAGLFLAPRSINQINGTDLDACVTNCVFEACTNVHAHGSALNVAGGAKIIGCVFTNCYAGAGGGGLSGDAGGGVRGGAVMVTLPQSCDTLIENCKFYDNVSDQGAGALASGIYAPQDSNKILAPAITNEAGIVLRNCHFVRNRSNMYGGAILAKVREAVACHFVSNFALKGSGAFNGPEIYSFNQDAKPTISTALIPATNRLSGCTFVGNSSSGSAGAYASGLYAFTSFSNCTFVGNSATNYGTLFLSRRMLSIGDVAAPEMNGFALLDCVFRENRTIGKTGNYQGLMYAQRTSVPYVERCHFESNAAPSWATALHLGHYAVVKNCSFVGNRVTDDTQARFGGAIFFEGPYGQVANCLFVGNTNLTASKWGCCINANGNTQAGKGLKVYNCTFARNGKAVLFGTHGTLTDEGMQDVSTVNCLFYRNASIFYRPLSYYNCTNCYGEVEGFADGANGNIKGDMPRFSDSENGDWTLAEGSPCLNAGLNADWMATARDLAGRPRIDAFYRRVDIGCYETPAKGFGFILK